MNATAQLYKPLDIDIHLDKSGPEQFTTVIIGHFEGPQKQVLRVPGFCRGGGVWTVRFSPTAQGSWTYRIAGMHSDVDLAAGEITCAQNDNQRIHGGLLVDRDAPHHFIFEDGTRYFLMGYECNWLWAPGLGDPEIAKVKDLIDQIHSAGFNQVFMNVYAHDTSWRPGRTETCDYGPPSMYAWEGTNDTPDHSRLNTAFFDNLDRVINYLSEQGIIAHLYLRVYNKKVNWPANRSPEDDLYFTYIVSRYQAYPNVIWDFSKESFKEPDKAYIADRIRLIRKTDGYGRLVTVHDDSFFCHTRQFDGLIDFITDQHQPDDRYMAAIYYTTNFRLPYVNAEFGYERSPDQDVVHAVAAQNAKDLLHRAYDTVMAGVYPTYYYNRTAWDIIDTSVIPEGYAYFRILINFFSSLPWWRLKPDLGTVWRSGVRCLRDGDREIVYYFPGINTSAALLCGISGSYECSWLHIYNGDIVNQGICAFDIAETSCDWLGLASPFDKQPCLLYLKKVAPREG